MNNTTEQPAPVSMADHPKLIRKVLRDHPTRAVAIDSEQAIPTSSTPADSRQRWLKMATNDVDRAGDILVISGMDAADFMRNPQFLWQHGVSGAEMNTIGKILRLEQTATALYALAEYADETIAPLAGQIFRMDEAGLLPANSIGFRPIEWEDNAFGGITFTKWQLIECSKVELPMNPKAIDDGAPKSYISADAAEQWLANAPAAF